MKSILVQDFHLHSGFLQHTKGSIFEFAKEASLLDYSKIAITEHFSYPFSFEESNFNKNYDTLKSEKRFINQSRKSMCLDDYIATFSNVREQVPDIEIVVGIEADYFVGMDNKLKIALSKKQLDYCLGAVHYIKDPNSENFVHVSSSDFVALNSRLGENFIYESYFSCLVSAVKSGLFDCIAHIDYLKKKFKSYSEEKAMPFIEEILKEMVKKNVGLEINTNGFFDVGENYASQEIVENFLRLGGQKIVIGSDSHSVEEFKRAHRRVTALCKKYQDFLWWGKE